MMYQSVQYGHMWGAPWFYGVNGVGLLLGAVALALMAALIALKGYALWSAAVRKQIWWFIAILIFNTVGILEAIYIIFFVKEWHKRRGPHHNHTDQSHHSQK